MTEYHTGIRLGLLLAIEYCWNVFPSSVASSSVLFGCHLVMLVGLLRSSSFDQVSEKKLS